MNIHCLQHVPFENPGTITEWAALNHYSIGYTYFFENDFLLPSVNDIDALIVMGGNMNVDEEAIYPWLQQEKAFIKAAIDAGKKVMGICLGSQLVAAACGSKVYPDREKEIGFFPIQFNTAALLHPLFSHFNNTYTVFQWHGDTFDLPENAWLIASSAACKHQGYLIGNNVLGLQFHFEMNETILSDMFMHDGKELEEKGNYIQTKAAVQNGTFHLEQNRKDMFLLLDKFFTA